MELKGADLLSMEKTLLENVCAAKNKLEQTLKGASWPWSAA